VFDSQFVAFLLVVTVLTITPGADTLLVVKNTMRGGRRAGWATMAGILGGCLVHATLSAVGLSVILMRSATAFHVVKVAGAAYLVWIGIRTLRDGGARVEGDDAPAAVPRLACFREGLATNVLNPKVAMFYLAFLPQFIRPGDPVLAKSILLACVHNLLGILWLGGIAIAVGRGRNWIRRPSVRTGISRVSGVMLVGLGLRLALDRR
jgi:threonine/homoserine/homoserine lactone efflux protein